MGGSRFIGELSTNLAVSRSRFDHHLLSSYGYLLTRLGTFCADQGRNLFSFAFFSFGPVQAFAMVAPIDFGQFGVQRR